MKKENFFKKDFKETKKEVEGIRRFFQKISKWFKKKFDREGIYNYLNLDKRLNRYLFIFGVFFGYFVLFWVIPAIIIWSRNIEDVLLFLKIFILSPKNLLVNITELMSYIPNILYEYILYVFYNIAFWLEKDLDSVWSLHYLNLLAPVLVLIPIFAIHKILPKFKMKYILLWGGVAVIFSVIYIYIYNMVCNI